MSREEEELVSRYESKVSVLCSGLVWRQSFDQSGRFASQEGPD
jgi:hypothetical protein